jgi:monoterpene epsilon-lactone hydrolase
MGRAHAPLARAVLLACLLAAAGASRQQAACTPPRTGAEATKPFCAPPDGVSQEARDYLATAHVNPVPTDVSTPDAARRVRDGFERGRADMVTSANGGAKDYFSEARRETLGGVPVVIATPAGYKPGGPAAKKLLFFLHGGAYVVGSCPTQWTQGAIVARDLGARMVCVDYRLAPEHPFPAGLDDAVAAYRAALKSFAPKDIALLGDSAGGGMVMALLQRLRAAGLPAPAAAVLFSPWVELTGAGDTQRTLVGVDPQLHYAMNLENPALAYVGGDRSKLTDPLVSPLRADWSKAAAGQLPPVLIQIGLRDTFLSHAAELHRKLKAAGQPVEFDPWDGLWHDFQAFIGVPEARVAQAEAADFLRRHLKL